VLAFSLTAFCQEPEKRIDTIAPDNSNSIIFTCAILEPESKSPAFSVLGDTVFFKVYYIDFECDRYLYEFERQDIVFVVRRIPMSDAVCDKSSDVIYGFEGTLIHVAPGRYQFQLESEYEGARSVIFREVISVK
jgi:hypothetical protein